jgi:alanine racemase
MNSPRAVVDLAAIRANTRRLLEASGGVSVMAVVKANGYGHGAVPVARAALAGGATWLGVAQLTEALAVEAELGAARAGVPLLAWLYPPDADFGQAIKRSIDLGVASLEQLEAVALAEEASGPARVHLKLDTGLGRSGAPPALWDALVVRGLELQQQGLLELVGVWSHFAYADQPGHPAIQAQIEVFEAGLERAKRLGARFAVRHLANSAALLTGLPVTYDMVRPGLALYGLSPIPELQSAASLGLKPAMTLEAYLSLVKPVPGGQGLSYGHVYTTAADTLTGVVPLGYGDGLLRAASNRGPVLVGGRRLRVAGRICMDQFVLDLGPNAADRPGDRVVLFGPGTDGEPTAQDWADAAGTISYEIVTALPAQLERVYVDSDQARRLADEQLPGSDERSLSV